MVSPKFYRSLEMKIWRSVCFFSFTVVPKRASVHAPYWKTCRKFVVLMEKIPSFSSCSHRPFPKENFFQYSEKAASAVFPFTADANRLCVFEKRFPTFLIAECSKLIKNKRNRLAVNILKNFIHTNTVSETDKRKAHARAFCAPRSSDPMNIKLLFIRQIIVEHRFYVVYVNAARRNIRRHKDFKFTLPESGHYLVSQRLAHVAMQAFGIVSSFFQPFAKACRHIFCVAEDHHAFILIRV